MKQEGMKTLDQIENGFNMLYLKMGKKTVSDAGNTIGRRPSSTNTTGDKESKAAAKAQKKWAEEAANAVEDLKAQLNSVTYDSQLIGLSEWDKSIQQIKNDAAQMTERYSKFFGKEPELSKMIDKIKELKLEQVEAAKQLEIDGIFESQRQQFEDLALGGNEYLLTLQAINREYEKNIKNGFTKETAEDIRENSIQLENFKKISASVRTVTDAMENSLGNALAHFAEGGAFKVRDMAAAFVKQLQAMAAMKTAQLLMEGVYNSVMAMVYTASYNTDMAAKASMAASAAYSGIPVVAGIVAGSGLAGMAHDGITSIPEDGTWLLKKNERVVDSDTNADLKDYLKGGGRNTTIHQNITINGGDEKSVMKALPYVKKAAIDAVTQSISSRGDVFKMIQVMKPA
jgi:hypothetical protein